ncbi:MAG: NADH-quinone oxidoreductase subunit N [Proteobacteria bacterium]|nr:NADH-quinone oxidoreductase subunit N [Pseudomonadota bacterium]MCZ6784860.1 NADH-quinone oxidoreductase subunit N [Pseudomonadota bacterium]
MNPSALQFHVLGPVAFVSIGSLAVLLGEVFLSRKVDPGDKEVAEARIGSLLAAISTVSLLLAIYAAGFAFFHGTSAAFNPGNPMLSLDPLSSFAMMLVGVGALLSVWLSITYLPALHINHGEYYALLLLATAGMFVMISSVNMIAVFMGLELMSIPIYALAGFNRGNLRSNESGLKYFIIGTFASAILLYGMALLYGATGHTDFAGIRAAFDPSSPLAVAGLVLVVVGFAFKISSVPFHQWTPDVYEGAPTSVTAFMSVTVKTSAFVILLRFLTLALPEVGDDLNAVFWVLAALSMVVGNFMAIIQTNVKRLLAYSSIAHAGYLLVGFVAGTEEARAAVLFYLMIYMFMNLGAFGVVVALAQGGRESDRIDDFAGLAQRRPGLAALMTLFMLALAGIPGTAGFMGKFYIFSAAVQAGYIWLAILGVLTSVVSVYYYLRVPVAMYMSDDTEEEPAEASSSELVVLGLCALAVIYFGLFPNHDPLFDALRLLDLAGTAIAQVP